MKKLILAIAIGMVALTSNAQWVLKNVNNGIDLPYRIAYSKDFKNNGILKLEEANGYIALYVTGLYFCDETPSVDIGLDLGSGIVRYYFAGTKSKDNTTVFFINDLMSEEYENFLINFKRANSFVIRVNETHCEDNYYRFNMTGSSKAVDFILQELKKYE